MRYGLGVYRLIGGMTMMKKIITGACTLGGMISAVLCMAILYGVDYEELFGITILQIVYLVILMAVLLICGSKMLIESRNSEKIPVRVKVEDEDDINYIIRDEDF